jgi:hypothetical protein
MLYYNISLSISITHPKKTHTHSYNNLFLTSNIRNTMYRNSSALNADKLYNIPDGLHNFTTHEVDDECVELYKVNYLFMKQSPMYVRLEQKYKNLKKKLREQSKMIDLLNCQYFETVEKYAELSVLSKQESRETTTECRSVCVQGLSKHDLQSKDNVPVEIKIEPTVSLNTLVNDLTLIHDKTVAEPVQNNAVYKVINTKEVEVVEEEEVKVEVVKEKEVKVEVVKEKEVKVEVVKEKEVKVEVVKEKEVEVEVVEEEEVEVEVVEEEEVEVVEEEEVEVEVVEEEEVEVVEEEEVEVVEEEEVEVEVVEEEEEGVYETVIGNKKYYITNETDGDIYSILEDGEIGDVIGKYVNSVPQFTNK